MNSTRKFYAEMGRKEGWRPRISKPKRLPAPERTSNPVIRSSLDGLPKDWRGRILK